RIWSILSIPIGSLTSSIVGSTPYSLNTSTNALTGAKHPKSTVVPAQSNITASILLMVVLLQKFFYDRAYVFDIFPIDLADISNPKCLSLRHFARIDSISSFLDVLIHLRKCKTAFLRIKKGGDDRSLVFAVDVRINPHF